MNKIQKLGQLTAKQAAGPGQLLGEGIDYAGKTLLKALGSGMGSKSTGLGRLATGASTLAGLGAANEGLAYFGAPHMNYGGLGDNDLVWSPKLQGVRQSNRPGIFGQATEFFKRPIQSMFGNTNPNISPMEAMEGFRPPPGVIKGWEMGPNGRWRMNLQGSMDAPLAPSYLEMLDRMNQLGKTTGLGGMGKSTPTGSNQNVKYIFGAPPLPASSTF